MVLGPQELEEHFVRSFHKMQRERRGRNPVLFLNQVPLPKVVEQWGVVKQQYVYIKGVSGAYSGLNGEVVVLLSKPSLKRKVTDHMGQYARDRDGNYIEEDVAVPRGSVAVVSKRKLGVRRKDKEEGYQYVDCGKNKRGVLEYIYIVPREVCYRVKHTCLGISLNKPRRSFYNGVSVALTNGYTLYMCVYPYDVRYMKQATTIKVLKTKNSVDYREELSQLVTYLEGASVMFEVRRCGVSYGNLALQDLEGSGDVYKPYADENILDERVQEDEVV